MTDSTTKPKTDPTHNLDQHMRNLREIVAQDKKRIGILLGAGAPESIRVDGDKPLIPMISDLTDIVKESLPERKELIDSVIANINKEKEKSDTDKKQANIEDILSEIRFLSAALKDPCDVIGGYNHEDYKKAAKEICDKIGEIVKKNLPPDKTPYSSLASWIGGAHRKHAVEIFTTNYDLLMEQAFENAKIPFFTGFTGFHEPFFDTASIHNNDDLPSRWARLWKLHGSLGWEKKNGKIIRGQSENAVELIYPDHLKYDATQKLPYVALLDRLKIFLREPDTLLLSCGFSYCDSHVWAVIDEALSGNPKASVFAFMYEEIKKEADARELALQRSNFSVYARDMAIVNTNEGKWRLGENKNKEWENIRKSFCRGNFQDEESLFTLGDFGAFAKFLNLSKTDQDDSKDTSASDAETK